jgi:hypothetical protein
MCHIAADVARRRHAQGTPTLGELKLQYYSLMIRYHLVRLLVLAC